MFIVTGVSKGLGQAIVKLLLGQGEKVIGIGRSHQFNHSKFSFIECDLIDINAIKNIQLPVLKGQLTLINNAGILGNVKRLSDQKSLDIAKVLLVKQVLVNYTRTKVCSWKLCYKRSLCSWRVFHKCNSALGNLFRNESSSLLTKVLISTLGILFLKLSILSPLKS